MAENTTTTTGTEEEENQIKELAQDPKIYQKLIDSIVPSIWGYEKIKESLLLQMPVIGRVYHSSVLGRIAEAMAMMVAAGCGMPACLRLASGASESEKLFLESDTLACQIERGENILEAGQFCEVIPRLFLYSIQLGTQRNELQDNLYSLGQMYAEQTRCRQTRLQMVLLPIMIVLVGAIIVVTVLAMFLPMIQIISGLSK